jgi:hypothetical protein
VFVVCDFHTPVALEYLHSHLLPKVDLTPVAQNLTQSQTSRLWPKKLLLECDLTPVAKNYLLLCRFCFYLDT